MVDHIKSLERSYSMEKFYDVVGGSRQKHNQGKETKMSKVEKEKMIIKAVQDWRIQHPRMGSRTTYKSMQASGMDIPIGITRFEQLLSERGMTVGFAKRFFPKTSDGKGKGNYPNLCNGLILNGVHQLVVADITYFWLKEDWVYLFIMKDAYSHRVISLIPCLDMKAGHVVEMLNDLRKFWSLSALNDCILHTDNGSQFEATIVKSMLSNLQMKISRAENCKQNGSIEQMNHVIKNMYLKHYGIQTFSELKTACKKVKRLMNTERSIEELDYMTVQEFEKYILSLPLGERPKKALHDFTK